MVKLFIEVHEMADVQMQLVMHSLKESIKECLGAKLTQDEFEEVGTPDTPEYLSSVDKDQKRITFPHLDEEIAPEVGDEYILVSVMIPH